MFINERLFTIQAFTITRVHCTREGFQTRPIPDLRSIGIVINSSIHFKIHMGSFFALYFFKVVVLSKSRNKKKLNKPVKIDIMQNTFSWSHPFIKKINKLLIRSYENKKILEINKKQICSSVIGCRIQ